MRSSGNGISDTRINRLQRTTSAKPSKPERSLRSSTRRSPAKIIDDCERCMQKELCPVYMGQSCLLVNERLADNGLDKEPADGLS